MLQAMRNNLKGVVAYLLVGLITVVFALFGADALFMGGLTQDTVAEVNGRKITELDLARGLAQQKAQIRNMLGDNADPRFLQDEFLRPTVKQNLVQRELLVAVAEQNDLRASNEEIDKKILTDNTFHSEGEFDADLYKSILRQYGFRPSSYRDELKENFLLDQYQQTFTTTGFTTQAEIQQMAQLQFETRDYSYVNIELEKAKKGIEVNDELLSQYYEIQKSEFMSEEKVAVEYILLSQQALSSSVVISEEDIAAQYEAEIENLQDKTERRAAHILIEENEDGSHLDVLSELQSKLSQGEEFAQLAQEYSADTGSASQGGDVGVTTGESFVEEFENALAEMKVGEVSEPVQTQFGYHIIKLLDQKEVEAPSFEESKERIARELKVVVAEELYEEKINLLREESANVSSLADLTQELSEEDFLVSAEQTEIFTKLNPMPLMTKNPAFRDPSVIEALFNDSLEQGRVTEVLELRGDKALVMRVTEYQPSEQLELSAVREQVEEKFRTQHAEEVITELALELTQKVQAGELLKDLAVAAGVSVVSESGQYRNSKVDSHEVLAKAFALPKPDEAAAFSVGHHQLNNGDWAVIVVESSTSPSQNDLTQEQKDQVTSRLKAQVNDAEFSALVAMLLEDAKVVYRSQTLAAQPN